MPESFADLKRKELEKRLADLKEEYKAASAQWSRTRDDVERLRLKRQMEDLETTIKDTEHDLERLDNVSQQLSSAKLGPTEASGQSGVDLTPSSLPPALSEPSKEALDLYSGWTEERLLRVIGAGTDSEGQDQRDMVQVLCWRLRQKLADKVERLKQLQARRAEAQQKGSVVSQAILNDILVTGREISRLEDLIQQARQLCRSEK